MKYRSVFKAVFSFTWGPVSLEKKTLQKTNKQIKNSEQAKQTNKQTNKKQQQDKQTTKNCYHDKNCKPVQSRSIPTPAEAAIWLLVEQCVPKCM